MPLTPPAARGIADRGLSRFSLAGLSADRIPHARTRPSDLMSRIRCMFTANDLPLGSLKRRCHSARNHCALKTAGHTRSPGDLEARGAIPELPSDAARSRATLNRRSDDSVAHAVDVQSMSARRGQRRTRTAEYDGFSVAEESARAGAKLRVNRRRPFILLNDSGDSLACPRDSSWPSSRRRSRSSSARSFQSRRCCVTTSLRCDARNPDPTRRDFHRLTPLTSGVVGQHSGREPLGSFGRDVESEGERRLRTKPCRGAGWSWR
jgi:hypothetical protein